MLVYKLEDGKVASLDQSNRSKRSRWMITQTSVVDRIDSAELCITTAYHFQLNTH